jgi:hypothetical protein
MMRFCGTVLLAVATGVTSSFDQAPVLQDKAESEILKREISLPEFRYSETPAIIQKALLKAHLPGGIVTVNCSENRRQYALSTPRISIRKLLFAMEQLDPEYTWQFSNGVVNLLPQQGIPELLETRFSEFNVQGVTSYEALNALLEGQETKRKMAVLGLDKAVISLSIPTYYDPEHSTPENSFRFDLNLQNVTFRQILNEIVTKEGHKIWVYMERRCGEETLFSVFLGG